MPLWILPALGGVPRRLGEVLGRDAAWSPTDKGSHTRKGHELYVCNADGTETRKTRSPRQSGKVAPLVTPWQCPLRFTVGDPADDFD